MTHWTFLYRGQIFDSEERLQNFKREERLNNILYDIDIPNDEILISIKKMS